MNQLTALLMAGHLSEAEGIIEKLRAGDPDRLDLLGIEGILRARRGNAAGAREASADLDDRRAPYQSGAVDYWRAAIAAWSGEPERALTLLWQAHEQGRPRGPALHADPFLQPLWDLPAFRNLAVEGR
jgi:hypothetical protein